MTGDERQEQQGIDEQLLERRHLIMDKDIPQSRMSIEDAREVLANPERHSKARVIDAKRRLRDG